MDIVYIDESVQIGTTYYYAITAIDYSGNESTPATLTSVVTSAQQGPAENIPNTYELNSNYPNPFNPSTSIRYGLPAESNVRLQIYNILGQLVASLVNEKQPAGYQSVIWNANVASGIYFYRLEAVSATDGKTFVDVKKMLLLK